MIGERRRLKCSNVRSTAMERWVDRSLTSTTPAARPFSTSNGNQGAPPGLLYSVATPEESRRRRTVSGAFEEGKGAGRTNPAPLQPRTCSRVPSKMRRHSEAAAACSDLFGDTEMSGPVAWRRATGALVTSMLPWRLWPAVFALKSNTKTRFRFFDLPAAECRRGRRTPKTTRCVYPRRAQTERRCAMPLGRGFHMLPRPQSNQ